MFIVTWHQLKTFGLFLVLMMHFDFCICLLLISFHPVNLGKYHSAKVDNEDHSNHQNEEETTGQILQHEKSAAGVLCQLKTRHCTQASHLTFTKDVLGIVASLGQLEDENLSRSVGSCTICSSFCICGCAFR